MNNELHEHIKTVVNEAPKQKDPEKTFKAKTATEKTFTVYAKRVVYGYYYVVATSAEEALEKFVMYNGLDDNSTLINDGKEIPFHITTTGFKQCKAHNSDSEKNVVYSENGEEEWNDQDGKTRLGRT